MTATGDIKVLIVEDCPVFRQYLSEIIRTSNGLALSGAVDNAEKAFAFLHNNKVDVITMDVVLPGIDGIEATRKIMQETPLPIVVLSNIVSPGQPEMSFKAMQAGAVTALQKPHGAGHPQAAGDIKRIVDTIKAMAGVKVVRRWSEEKINKYRQQPLSAPEIKPASTDIPIVAIGVSTGGPPVLEKIISALPEDFSLPVVIVQHMTPGFLNGLIDWLHNCCKIDIKLAEHDEIITGKCIYFAPPGKQLGITANRRIALTNAPAEHSQIPSVSYFFRSLLPAAKNVIAILLTGMGRDGAQELKSLMLQGAVTIAQDEATSVVFGMPGHAVELGAAKYVLPPEDIISMLNSLADKYAAAKT